MARREWGSGSIYPVRGGRYWRVSVPLPSALGRRRQEWQYRSKAAAERQLEAVQRRLSRGLPAEESRVTLAEYAPQWLDSLQVADSTRAMYRSLVTHQLGDLNGYRLTRIAPPDIRRLLADREREGYAGRTRRGILDVLRMILRLAQNDGLVERNAAELVDPPKIDAKEPVHFTAEQARRFLEVAKDDRLFSLFAVALGTGLRRGELLGLTWRDADLAAGVVRVRKGKTAASTRLVPLPAFALRALLQQSRAEGTKPHPAARVWTVSSSHVTRQVAAICRRAGLPRLTTHGLRHTFATLMREADVPLETRRDLMGHSRTEMTAFYSHGKFEQQQRAAADLERLIG